MSQTDVEIIEQNIRIVAGFMQACAVIVPSRRASRDMERAASWLVGPLLCHLHSQETTMGRVADVLQKLQDLAKQNDARAQQEKDRADALQKTLDEQQGRSLDSADMAALDSAAALLSDTQAGTATSTGATTGSVTTATSTGATTGDVTTASDTGATTVQPAAGQSDAGATSGGAPAAGQTNAAGDVWGGQQ